MGTYQEKVDELVQEIKVAVAQDRVNQRQSELRGYKIAKATDRSANTIKALTRVHKSIESLITPENKAWTEEEKDAISRSIAEALGLKNLDRFRFTIKQASIDSGVVVIQQIEDIINSVK